MVALMDLLTATQILEFSGINNDQKPIFLIDQDFLSNPFSCISRLDETLETNILTSNNNCCISLEF